ncbi:MAG: hypothetical protein HY899_19235 [Deltaproteobacteria bacterium]|nr:hypothetical protein [Deltaproteobacteria bacterium]
MVAGALALAAGPSVAPAFAQDMAQLDPLAKNYTLGGFRYEGPDADGWRQVANAADSLQLVYVEQLEEGKFNTRCHVIIEIDNVAPEFGKPEAAGLAEAGRRQQMEKAKDKLAAVSPIAAVPGVVDTYTYRFLVHGPADLGKDFYQVYYVVLSPDKSQYVVMQVNVLDQDYENQLYFQQFYATLAKLKYQTPAGDGGAKDAASDAGKPAAGDTAKDAAKTAPADLPKASTPPK